MKKRTKVEAYDFGITIILAFLPGTLFAIFIALQLHIADLHMGGLF